MHSAGVTQGMTALGKLLLAWVPLCGPVGAVMYLVTTFLFAFSGGQYRMVPVVDTGFWVVGLGVLAVGAVALARGRSVGAAVTAMLVSAAAAWSVAVVIYWLVCSAWAGPGLWHERGGHAR